METQTETKIKTKIKCKFCGYEWLYRGTMRVMCTCPDCMKRIKIQDCKVIEG
jgi:predicted Zn-ribbon and HTH transcriptional regulator